MNLLITILATLLAPCLLLWPAPAQSQSKPAAKIHVVYMGGPDCPPCNVWRGLELPKLEATEVFKRIQFTPVTKVITSSVPPRFFLPEAAKPLKDKLDAASNGITGSPQTIILVNGEVFDYKVGTYSASEFEARLLAIESDAPYPFARCARRRDREQCASSH